LEIARILGVKRGLMKQCHCRPR